MDVRWIHNSRRTRRVTYREGATDREAVDKMVPELLRMASGNGRLVDKRDGLYGVNYALQVACDDHCGTYVGASPNGVGLKIGHTFVLNISLVIGQRSLLIRVTRVCIGCQMIMS